MDLKLENGDIATETNGSPVKVYGIDELIQQAVICITVPKGSYIYDRNLGSQCHRLKDGFSPEDIFKLEQFINESIYSLGNIYAKVKSASVDGGKLRVTAEFTAGDETYEKEVVL